jgi:hypothetical protein
MFLSASKWASVPWWKIGFALLLLATLLNRFHHLSHGLWFDEVWVANSVLGSTWKEMFFYPSWLQTSPPGFLILLRGSASVLGIANWVFHWLPYVAGVSGVALLTWLYSKEFGPARGLWVGVLAAASTRLVEFSKEAKQYSGEFLVSVLILTLLLCWRQIPRRAFLWGMPLCFGVAFLFSLSSVLLLPAALCYLLLLRWSEGEELGLSSAQTVRWAIYWAMATALLCAPVYYFLLMPNRDATLQAFWSQCYLPPGNPGALLGVVYKSLHSVLVETLSNGVTAGFLGLRSAGSYLLVLILPLSAIFAFQNRGRKGLPLACLAVVPILTAVCANLASVYPLCEVRFAQFLVPSVLLLHAVSLELLPSGEGLRRAACSALGFVVVLLTGFSFASQFWEPRVVTYFEDAFAVLVEQRKTKEPLYVHGSLKEQFTFYSRSSPLQRENVLQSITNPGCCPRGLDLERSYLDPVPFRDEFSLMLVRAGTSPFWMFYARQPENQTIPRREEPLHLKTFGQLGCRQDLERQYRDVALYRFSCPADALSQLSAMKWPPDLEPDSPLP